MQTMRANVIIVELTKAEVNSALTAHFGELKPDDATLQHGQGPNSPSKFLGIVFGITREQLDAVLRPMISALPALGSYMVRLVDEVDKPDIGARVRWQG